MPRIVELLEYIREQQDIPREVMLSRFGITKERYRDWLNGKIPIPSAYLRALVKFLLPNITTEQEHSIHHYSARERYFTDLHKIIYRLDPNTPPELYRYISYLLFYSEKLNMESVKIMHEALHRQLLASIPLLPKELRDANETLVIRKG